MLRTQSRLSRMLMTQSEAFLTVSVAGDCQNNAPCVFLVLWMEWITPNLCPVQNNVPDTSTVSGPSPHPNSLIQPSPPVIHLPNIDHADPDDPTPSQQPDHGGDGSLSSSDLPPVHSQTPPLIPAAHPNPTPPPTSPALAPPPVHTCDIWTLRRALESQGPRGLQRRE